MGVREWQAEALPTRLGPLLKGKALGAHLQDFAESTDDTFVSTGFTSGLFGSPARQLSAEGKPQPTVNGQHSTAKSPLKVVSYPSKTDAAGKVAPEHVREGTEADCRLPCLLSGLSGPNPVLAQGANASLRNEDVGSSGADDTEVDASGGGTGGPSAFDPLGDSESLGAAASIATLGTATDPLGGSKSFEAAATGATGGTTTDSFGGYQAFETAAFGATDAFGGAEPFEAAATGATGGTATCSFGGSEVFGALAFGATGPLGGSESFEAAATDPTGSAASNSFDTSEPLGAAAFGASFGAAGAGFAPYSEPLNKSTSFGSSGDTGGNSHGGGGVPASAASSAAAAPADAASETATGSFGGSAFKTSSVGGSESAALHGATAGFGAFDPPSTAAFGSSDPFADRAGEAFASVPFEAPRDTFGSAPVGFSAQGVGGASEPYPKLSSSETLSPEGSVRGFVEVAAGADRAKAAVEPPRAAAKGEGTTAAVLYDFIAQEDGEVCLPFSPWFTGRPVASLCFLLPCLRRCSAPQPTPADASRLLSPALVFSPPSSPVWPL